MPLMLYDVKVFNEGPEARNETLGGGGVAALKEIRPENAEIIVGDVGKGRCPFYVSEQPAARDDEVWRAAEDGGRL